jgi:hypothetical protein
MPTPRLEAAKHIGRLLADELDFLTAMPAQPSAAILYDRLNHDFCKAYTIVAQDLSDVSSSIYIDAITGIYASLWSAGISSRFVIPDELKALDPQKHPLLYVTSQLVMDDDMAAALRSYMDKGGWCVFDGKLGEIDKQGYLYQMIPGAGLAESLGFELLDIGVGDLVISVKEGENTFEIVGAHEKRQFDKDTLSADVIGTYSDGEPAVLKKHCGKGGAYYLSTFFWLGVFKQPSASAQMFLEMLAKRFCPQTVRCDNRALHVERLDGEDSCFVFVFNYSAEMQEADLHVTFREARELQVIELPEQRPATCNMANNKAVEFHIAVPAEDVGIYKLIGCD